MNRNSQEYKLAAAKAIRDTMLRVYVRLEKTPEKLMTVQQRRLKRRLESVCKF